MIFDALYESAKRGELLLIDGGYCRWHLRMDGKLIIYEIIATRKGAGSEMLAILKSHPSIISIIAKCPENLQSNEWYKKVGFIKTSMEITKKGNRLNVWELSIGDE